MEDAGQRLSAASLVGGQPRSCSLASPSQPAQTWKSETCEWCSTPGARRRGALRKGEQRKRQVKGKQEEAVILLPPRPAPFPSGEVTDFTCLLSCCFSSFFQPPPHSPTSPLKKQPRQGRTRVFLILLDASRPQPGEHPDCRADWRRRS